MPVAASLLAILLALPAICFGASLTKVNNHFFANGEVNGVRVEFLIDTGASTTSVPRSIANGMRLEGPCYPVRLQTANGTVTGCSYTNARIRFASYATIATVVVAPELTSPLLGMNVLGKMKLEQLGDKLTMAPTDDSIVLAGEVPAIPFYERLSAAEWVIILVGLMLATWIAIDKFGRRR
jgi:clan AA aspartic protease (TIGR02281 family)